ncbi:class I SAM-dependent methyltransferase [Spirillospora sp. NPDC052242]
MSRHQYPIKDAGAPYDGFADIFAAEAAVSAYNAHYDRPTVLGLLGDVSGRRVLDAGCGPGLYLAELKARGAEIAGFDQSADMIRVARQRLGHTTDLRCHDLGEPLHWLDDHTVDLVLAALVIHYVDDRVGALRELHRVLRPSGRLVLSTSHPTADWLDSGGGYFEQRYEQQQWSHGFTHRYWRQPLQRWTEEFTAVGFVIERLVEHRPQATMSQRHPAEYAKLTREPGFIAYRLAKSAATR